MSLTADDVYRTEFHVAPIGRRGYARAEVDKFVDRIARTLSAEDDLTPAEVHHVSFAKPLLGKRGYDEREVDEFLDRAEDEIARRTGAANHEVPSARTYQQAGEAPAAERSRATDTSPHSR